ncbi:hypothetical protein Tco_0418103 [Tanacetum coccineum]
MKRGFRGVPRPLLPAMLPVVAVDQSARQADQAVDQPSSSEPLPSSSHPPVLSATTESEPTPVAEQITHPTSLTPEPDNRKTITVDDLLQLVPKLITKVDSLETELKQTKLTMGKALVKRYDTGGFEEVNTEISKKQRIDDKDVSDTEEKVGKVKERRAVKDMKYPSVKRCLPSDAENEASGWKNE